MIRQPSPDAYDIIKEWEGLRLKAYLCPAGVPTIGWGTTRIDNKPVKLGMTITKAQAEMYLRNDVAAVVAEVRKHTPRIDELTQSQFDAMVSLAYNLGAAQFITGSKKIPISSGKRSTVWRGIEARDPNMMVAGLLSFNKVGGKTNQGLVNRRKDELALFQRAVQGDAPPPPPDVPATPPSAPTPSPRGGAATFIATLIGALIAAIFAYVLGGQP